MLLCLTAIDEHQKERQFSCWLPELEVAFDFLNHIVAKGDVLVSAELIDQNQPTRLPVEAFDGISFLPVLQQLKLEWNTVLAEPPRLSIGSDVDKIRWFREQLARYEQRIIQLELMITDMNRLYQRAEDALRPSRQTSSNPYQSVLTRYESQLSQAHLLRKGLLERI